MKKIHKVIYDKKLPNKELVQKIRVFSDFEQACSFFRSVKLISVTKPLMEEENK